MLFIWEILLTGFINKPPVCWLVWNRDQLRPNAPIVCENIPLLFQVVFLLVIRRG